MIHSAAPLAQDLVLVGGGHAHALAMRMWAMKPLPGARLTLISPQPTTPYTGMLPGVVAGHYALEEHVLDLVRLARRAGARFIVDAAIGLDLDTKRVLLSERGALPFDVLSLDIGSSSAPIGATSGGFAPVKPFGEFLPALDAFLTALEEGRAQPKVVVIGGGVGGVELALALAHRLRAYPERSVRIVTRSSGASRGVGASFWRRILTRASQVDVELIDGFDAVEAADGVVRAADGREEAADLIVSAAGARAAKWLAETGLALDDAGFVRVGPTLAAEGRWDVFAAGDVASMTASPRPKAGVFAVRQAPVLLNNLRAALIGGGPAAAKSYRRYAPQSDYLKLVSLGDRSAVAEKYGLTWEGASVWRLKDRIDRAFMKKFAPAPMPLEPPPDAFAAGAFTDFEPLCTGCGAKVGAAVLEDALSSVAAPALRSETARGIGDDAALLKRSDGSFQAATVDQLRAFTEDAELFAEIATQHALSDIWAMGGAPEAALLSISLPRCAPKMQARMAEEILTGAHRALAAAGADLIGGHTAEGAELSLSVTALGGVSEAAMAQLSGAKPGDALILTKPLGAGVLLAAEMRQLADGAAAQAALDQMRRSNAEAAHALMRAGARAMTDVTGFGLLGHLSRMLAVDLGAEIESSEVPFLTGALELSVRGVRSSLYPSNALVLNDVDAHGADEALLDLLVDPQTSGGLLAALPPDAELDLAGIGARRIGVVVSRSEPLARFVIN